MEEEIIYKVEVQGITSIESLTKANKELREERKKLDLDTAEGQKRVQAINAQLDANTNKIKENVSALEKQRLNIGNYQSALDRVIPGFSGFTQGIQSATTASKALIATPLGAILAAVAVVLGVVVAALKKSEPVLDFFENIITQITANIDFLLTNLDKLGSILYDLATFNISGAIDKVKGLTQEMIAVARAAQLYLDILRELEDEQALFTVSSAQQENQIKALVIASKNRNLTFDEQREKIREALKLERELTEQRIDLARKEEVATIKQIALSRGLRQTEEENFDAFVERLLRGEELSGEEKKQVADLSAARIKAESESLAFREKAANMIAAIDDKKAAADEKNFNERIKQLNELSNLQFEIEMQEVEMMNRKEEAYRKAQEEIIKLIEKTNEYGLAVDFASLKASADAEAQEESTEANAEYQEELKKTSNLKAIEISNTKLYADSLGNLSGVLKQGTASQKAAASAQALINTFLGATNILTAKPPLPFPLNIIALGSTIATGLATVARINSVQGFARGGKITSGFGTPISRSNGDNILATVKTGEVILNQSQQAALGGARTFARIGVPGFATGGLVGDIARTSENSINMQSSLESLTQMKFYLAYTEFNEGQKKYVKAVESATVL